MEYNKLIAITGMPGLFELLSSKADGGVVRSLEDKSTKFVSNRIHNFSHLESIEVYTIRENVNLIDVFKAMQNAGEALPSEKDNNAVKQYFQKVFPDMDFERVYASDMKKMIKWYGIITSNNIELSLPEETETENESNNEKATLEETSTAATVESEAIVETEKPKKTRKKKAE